MKALWEMRISSPHDLIKFNDKATKEAVGREGWQWSIGRIYEAFCQSTRLLLVSPQLTRTVSHKKAPTIILVVGSDCG